MKKLLIILCTSFLLFSCQKKEEVVEVAKEQEIEKVVVQEKEDV